MHPTHSCRKCGARSIRWHGFWSLILGTLVLAATAYAERFDFDGPNDIAGQRVSPPIVSAAQYAGEVEGGVPMVVLGRGVGGSQALAVAFGATPDQMHANGGAIYVLPRPLTQADGAIRISVSFFPQPARHDPADPSTRYWAYCGGLTIGSGRGDGLN